MKKIKLIVTLISLCVFSSCIDIEEKIIINANNSGVYSISFDMTPTLKMLTKAGINQENELGDKKIDSLIALTPFVDTATILSAEEKELFKNGSVLLKIDEPNNIGKMTIICPFTNMEELSIIKKKFFTVVDKLDVSKKVSENNDSESKTHPTEVTVKENPIAQYYTFQATNGKLSYFINNKKELNQTIQQIKQEDWNHERDKLTELLIKNFHYNLIMTTPNKIKIVKGINGIISADKKTVTFKRSFADFINTPKNLEYVIEY